MLITKFSVDRYRSIVASESMELERMTVLVGPNNEGKSNLLRALTAGLELIEGFRGSTLHATRSQTVSRNLRGYKWDDDFPISLQEKTPNAKTVFSFEFALTEDEVQDFKREVGSNLNGILPVKVYVGADHRPSLKVVKKGPGGNSLNSKHEKISRFVSSRISVDYIPAVRSSASVERVIDDDIAKELRSLQEQPEVVRLYSELQARYAEAMEPYEKALLSSIQRFIPKANAVHLRFDGLQPGRGLTPRARLLLDDGEETLLSAKGDGIQSLSMLALKEAILDLDKSRSHVLTLEEPEAHLHPGAVRQLREVIENMSQSHQVVLTTHNPILVDHLRPARNVIIEENRARRAKNLDQIRNCLGVEMPDNMQSAAIILLVEGTTDKQIMENFLSRLGNGISDSLLEGNIRVEHCGGASNAPYQYRLWRNNLCQVHVLLDSDKSGREARSKLTNDGVKDSDITVISAPGYSCAEMEDFVRLRDFRAAVEEEFNVSLDQYDNKSKHPRDRFTQQVKASFTQSGQVYDSATEKRIKTLVADATNDSNAGVAADFMGIWEAVQRGLQRKLQSE